MCDLVNTADYSPRPDWGQTDEALLEKIFAPNKAEWESANAWFVTVPDRMQGAVHAGSDFTDPASYLNPDGTTAEAPEVFED